MTVTLKALPAVALAGPATTKCVAVAAVTLIALLVTVIALFPLSVAVIVWLPEVVSVALKVPVPLVNVLFAGKTAPESVLVNFTTPA